jgi:hypothetical protein
MLSPPSCSLYVRLGAYFGLNSDLARGPSWAKSRHCLPTDLLADGLSQLVADLIEPRVRTAIVELGAGRSARPDRANDLVAKLDHNATTEEHDVRQLGKWCN